MITLKAPIFFPIVFGLVEVFLLLGLASSIIKATRVTVNSTGIDIQNNWLLFTTNNRIAASEFPGIKLRIGMTVGKTSYYDLQAHTGRRTAYVGTGIRNKKEAEWLASEMERSLGKSAKPSSDQDLINA